MESTSSYIVAERTFRLIGSPLPEFIRTLNNFQPFETDTEGECDFTVRYIPEAPLPAAGPVLYPFECDGVTSSFHKTEEGYLLKMQHEDGTHSELWSDQRGRTVTLTGDLTRQMTVFALWMAYGLMNADRCRIPIHGSCIVNDGRAYLFLGESGTGKSTHTRLWREYIPGSHLLNDDSPIIAAEADSVTIYGSPWSGKTPCYHQLHFPLCGCVRLSQAPCNEMKRLSIMKAFAALHPSCPPEFAYDEALYEGISRSLGNILQQVPVYHLACLPDEAAARLSHDTLRAR